MATKTKRKPSAAKSPAKGRWFWLSFYSTSETGKRVRRLRQPFWSWCSGTSGDAQTLYSICCLVEDVKDEDAAWKLVREWFPVGATRFCNEVERGYRPGDRFPGYVPPPEFAGVEVTT